MSGKAEQELRELLNIYNPHNACTFAERRGGSGVYLSYRPQQTGRAYRSAAWQVVRPSSPTDPGGHFMDNRHKSFHVHRAGSRAEAEQDAREWAREALRLPDSWVKLPGCPGALFQQSDALIIRDALRQERKRRKASTEGS